MDPNVCKINTTLVNLWRGMICVVGYTIFHDFLQLFKTSIDNSNSYLMYVSFIDDLGESRGSIVVNFEG